MSRRPRFHAARSLVAALAVAGAAWLAAPGATAQDSQGIAAVVNDEIISVFDLEQRIGLVLASSNAPNTPEQRERARESALRGLIDEKLELQAAREKGIEVSDQEVADAVANIASNNNVPVEQFDAFLAQAGVGRATLESQLRAQIAWQKLVGRELSPRLSIGEEAIDAAMSRARAAMGKPEVLVSEIFLPVDSAAEEATVQALAAQIVREVKSGTPFRLLARQYSQATTAATGGDLGWVQQGQIPEEVEQALAGMAINTVSDPIRATGGYYVVGLRDRRMVATLDANEVKLVIHQLVLPVPTDPAEQANALERAKLVARQINGCDGLAALAASNGGEARDVPGELTLAQLPNQVRQDIDMTEPGRAAQPLVTPQGIQIPVVCSRTNPTTAGPSRETVQSQLEDTQLNMLARRYLRDLRRDATIEIR